MIASKYQVTLNAAASLTREEQLRLIEALQSQDTAAEPREKVSIMELRGLGREI